MKKKAKKLDKKNIITKLDKLDKKVNKNKVNTESLEPLPYDKTSLKLFSHITFGAIGYLVGFFVSWLFYRENTISIIIATAFVPLTIIFNVSSSKKKRLSRLLFQFQSFLESMVVSLQSGSTDLNALSHAYADMKIMYSEESDIAREVALVIKKFSNRQTVGEALMNFGERSGLEDVKLFASVYSSVEGKGDNTRDIVIRTQKILSDKIEIEAEIKTISSGASMEINIMIFVPVLIVGVMGFMGGEMMEGLFTPIGRVVTTICIFIFGAAYALGKKMTSIKV